MSRSTCSEVTRLKIYQDKTETAADAERCRNSLQYIAVTFLTSADNKNVK